MAGRPSTGRPAWRALRFAGVAGPILLRYRVLANDDVGGWERAHQRAARGLARLADQLGGLYIKLCQVVGARADVFPEVFVRELARFHDRVTPRPFSELAPALERELGRRLERVFARIDPEPLAAASLAQVHGAELRAGGAVVLKIQYPDAARTFAGDLANVRRALTAAAALFRGFALRDPIEEIAGLIAQELDFAREAASLARARAVLGADPDARVPAIHAELCTPRLLVLERLDGIPVHDLARLRAAGVDLAALGDRIARVYGRMIFEHGFFHADPHPGNLLVLADGRVGLLDFGLAKALPPGFPEALARLLRAGLAGDSSAATSAAGALGFELEGADPAAFQRALAIALGARHQLAELRDALGGLGARVPADIGLVVRTLVLLNGLSERLAPGERRIARALAAAGTAAMDRAVSA